MYNRPIIDLNVEEFPPSKVSGATHILPDNETVLSIYSKQNRFAAAFYKGIDNSVYVRPEFSENVDLYPICQSLLFTLNPTTCLINVNSDPVFQAYMSNMSKFRLKSSASDDEDDDSDNPNRANLPNEQAEPNDRPPVDFTSRFKHRFNLMFLTFNYYSLEQCRETLIQCKWNEINEKSPVNLDNRLNEIVNFKDEYAFKALSALLKLLEQRHLHQIATEEEYRPFRLNTICRYFEPNLLYIDPYTYQSLEIFGDECHPGTNKSGQKTGSSQSLYQMFNRCRSNIGRKHMELMFMSPVANHQTMTYRYRVIQFFVDKFGTELVQRLLSELSRVKSFTHFIQGIRKSRLNGRDWIQFNQTLQSVKAINLLLQEYAASIELFAEINNFVSDESFEQLLTAIDVVIDREQTQIRNTFVAASGVLSKLDQLRDEAAEMELEKNQILSNEVLRLTHDIDSIELVYRGNVGFVLKVLQKFNSKIDHQPHLMLIKEFSYKAHRFYLTPEIVELNKKFKHLPPLISSYESMLMQNLIEEIYPLLIQIRPKIHLIALLDVLIAFADTASKHKYVRPILNNSRHIQIVRGRHPTLEYYQRNVVPNNYESSAVRPMMVITGANTCGKSVYLKQNCLILFLAHIGSFVPADFCKLGSITRLLTHFSTDESMDTEMGSFAFETMRLGQIIKYSNQNSFIAIDEFGRTTKPSDGYCILKATLLHMIARNKECPHLILTTHFYRIHQPMSLSPMVTLKTFEIDKTNDSIVFRYEVKDGQADESAVLKTVSKLLHDPALIERLEYATEQFKIYDELEPVHCADYINECDQCFRVANQLIAFYRDQQETDNFDSTEMTDLNSLDSDTMAESRLKLWASEQLSELEEITKCSQLSDSKSEQIL